MKETSKETVFDLISKGYTKMFSNERVIVCSYYNSKIISLYVYMVNDQSIFISKR